MLSFCVNWNVNYCTNSNWISYQICLTSYELDGVACLIIAAVELFSLTWQPKGHPLPERGLSCHCVVTKGSHCPKWSLWGSQPDIARPLPARKRERARCSHIDVAVMRRAWEGGLPRPWRLFWTWVSHHEFRLFASRKTIRNKKIRARSRSPLSVMRGIVAQATGKLCGCCQWPYSWGEGCVSETILEGKQGSGREVLWFPLSDSNRGHRKSLWMWAAPTAFCSWHVPRVWSGICVPERILHYGCHSEPGARQLWRVTTRRGRWITANLPKLTMM